MHLLAFRIANICCANALVAVSPAVKDTQQWQLQDGHRSVSALYSLSHPLGTLRVLLVSGDVAGNQKGKHTIGKTILWPGAVTRIWQWKGFSPSPIRKMWSSLRKKSRKAVSFMISSKNCLYLIKKHFLTKIFLCLVQDSQALLETSHPTTQMTSLSPLSVTGGSKTASYLCKSNFPWLKKKKGKKETRHLSVLYLLH